MYPYLLRKLEISRINQVWATDITYIPLDRGFAYLVAIIDWHSRRVLSWRLSNTLDSSFCVEALHEAMSRFGKPEIFNTDQGAQFTSDAFTSVLRAADVRISMDGKGRCLDNVCTTSLWPRAQKLTDRAGELVALNQAIPELRDGAGASLAARARSPRTQPSTVDPSRSEASSTLRSTGSTSPLESAGSTSPLEAGSSSTLESSCRRRGSLPAASHGTATGADAQPIASVAIA